MSPCWTRISAFITIVRLGYLSRKLKVYFLTGCRIFKSLKHESQLQEIYVIMYCSCLHEGMIRIIKELVK